MTPLDGHIAGATHGTAAVEGTSPPPGHLSADAHHGCAGRGTNSLDGHMAADAHASSAVEGTHTPRCHAALATHSGSVSGASHHPPGQPIPDTQVARAGRDHATAAATAQPEPLAVAPLRATHLADQPDVDAQFGDVGEDPTPDQATCTTSPIACSPSRDQPPARQKIADIHPRLAGGAPSPHRATLGATPTPRAPGRDHNRAGAANDAATPMVRQPRLLDPTLALAADVLNDLEHVRIANENRLRQLTRSETDTDGEQRGFGLDERHPDVARLSAIVETLAHAEHDATLQLQRTVRRHPLGSWVKNTVGIGEKQGARLLAAIGDPYWNELHERPRTVSELWAYSGYHTLPIGHWSIDTQRRLADGSDLPADQSCLDSQGGVVGGEQTAGGDPSHQTTDTQEPGARVAARRRKGQRANWSAAAKMRAYLCAESCIKQAHSPYRTLYDTRREVTRERTHAEACVRCGPAGKPAPTGTPWSAGHQHADALRIVAKEILKDLWRAARNQYMT